jgi:hypothetical protein
MDFKDVAEFMKYCEENGTKIIRLVEQPEAVIEQNEEFLDEMVFLYADDELYDDMNASLLGNLLDFVTRHLSYTELVGLIHDAAIEAPKASEIKSMAAVLATHLEVDDDDMSDEEKKRQFLKSREDLLTAGLFLP